MEMLLRGADPLNLGAGAATAVPQDDAKNGEFERRPRTWYEKPDHWDRQPTDKDDWDIPEGEVDRLAMLFPGSVMRTRN